MTVIIKKGDTKKNIELAVKKLNRKSSQSRLSEYYGKLKGKYGDGLNYQKTLRNEWD